MRRRTSLPVLALAAALAFTAAGCQNDASSTAEAGHDPQRIAQPVVRNLRVAPASDRVDLAVPEFPDATNVTNPLFPVSKQRSVLLLGRVDGKPFRTEVTLLPETRIIEWEGRQVETLVSQYTAFLDGRIHEVAYDFYAQDAGGAVWYFGEDVFNFADGTIVDTHGTWLAGRDGPAAMIMPARPKVGDVYRPENIPGLVFEEVTVKAVGQTLPAPLGLVKGGLVVQEVHMAGSKERKTFAPGYGEFLTAGSGDVEALALAAPTDSLGEPTPAALLALERGASDVFDAARSRSWKTAGVSVKKLRLAWDAVRAGQVPNRLEPLMSAALGRLAESVQSRKTHDARQAAIDVARSSLDLQLRYRPVHEIDRARFDLWAAQILVDAAAGDAAAVNGDFFALDYVRDRIHRTFSPADRSRLNAQLEALNGAVADQDLEAAADAARLLRATLARVTV